MVRTQIQLDEAQASALKALATERGVSMAELVRTAVDRLLATGVSEDERRERARNAAGSFASGRRDVSERHDEHLADAFRE